MDVNRPKPRGWLRFSLRTMFVLVTVLCVCLAYHLHWINQRHVALQWIKTHGGHPDGECPPPIRLWCLGERGVESLIVVVAEHERIQRGIELRALLPESKIYRRYNDAIAHYWMAQPRMLKP
jgi:hypothetical protein